MKATNIFGAILMILASANTALADEANWPGPEWSSTACAAHEEVAVEHISVTKKYDEMKNEWTNYMFASILYQEDVDEIYIRWNPEAEVEVLCGEKAIVILHESDVFVEVVMPSNK